MTAAAVSPVQQSSVRLRQDASAPDRSAEQSTWPLFWIPGGGSGWMDFDPTEGGQIVIPVTLNGEPVRALIDTGFDYITIGKAFADAHHLSVKPWGRPAMSVGGPTQFYRTPNATLTIGAIRTTEAGMLAVVDLPDMMGGGIGHVDMVIGLGLLGQVEWEIDEDGKRIRFLKSGTDPIKDGIPIRTGPGRSRLVTDIEVGGSRTVPAMIDTGSDDQVSLPPPVAREIGFQGQTDMETVGLGGSVFEPIGRVTNLRVGSQSIPDAYATIGGSGWFDGTGIKALVGMRVLQRFNMVIDLPAGKMALTRRVTAPPSMAKSTSGVQGPYADGRLTITHVMKNSPAAAAGLKEGDAICAIDGTPMSQALVDRHWGRAAPGTRYMLKLCNGNLRPMTLRAFY